MNLRFLFFWCFILKLNLLFVGLFIVFFFFLQPSISCLFPILFEYLYFFIGLIRLLDCLYPFPARFEWIIISLVGVLVRLPPTSLLVALLGSYQVEELFVAFFCLAGSFCLFQNSCYLMIPRLVSCFWCRSLFLD